MWLGGRRSVGFNRSEFGLFWLSSDIAILYFCFEKVGGKLGKELMTFGEILINLGMLIWGRGDQVLLPSLY